MWSYRRYKSSHVGSLTKKNREVWNRFLVSARKHCRERNIQFDVIPRIVNSKISEMWVDYFTEWKRHMYGPDDHKNGVDQPCIEVSLLLKTFRSGRRSRTKVFQADGDETPIIYMYFSLGRGYNQAVREIMKEVPEVKWNFRTESSIRLVLPESQTQAY